MNYKMLFTFDDGKEYITELLFEYEEINEALENVYDNSTICVNDSKPIYINTSKLKMISLIKDGEKDNG